MSLDIYYVIQGGHRYQAVRLTPTNIDQVIDWSKELVVAWSSRLPEPYIQFENGSEAHIGDWVIHDDQAGDDNAPFWAESSDGFAVDYQIDLDATFLGAPRPRDFLPGVPMSSGFEVPHERLISELREWRNRLAQSVDDTVSLRQALLLAEAIDALRDSR